MIILISCRTPVEFIIYPHSSANKWNNSICFIPEINQKKAPNSPLKDGANVLIFPDLNSGNIGYKLVERLAKAEAVGPFMQGIAKPINDLSRGAKVKDIASTIAVTVLQCE